MSDDASGRSADPATPPAPGRVVAGGRRPPRFWRWLGTGTLVGVVVAAILTTMLGDPRARYSWGQSFFYLAFVLGIVGAVLAGLVAAAVDRRR